MRRIFSLSFFVVFIYSCHTDLNKNLLFSEVTNSNITFNNQLVNSESLHILNYLYFYNGAGVAAADFNNDGLSDIYFTGNTVADQLYLNKGNLMFQDVTEQALIDNKEPWTTGVTVVDINQDGFLDIYVCKVGKHLNLNGHNLLYVNQGLTADGVPQFKEQSKDYGLNFSGYSTQSIFFDYDLDGDLDMYLLNHSLYPNANYGNGRKRLTYDVLAGDRLYRNDNGRYIDVSSQSGISQGTIGYGLGISVSDLNNDGYPDIYIGNDFFENDYLYINQKDGTFKEINSNDRALGHTSHFSMGNVAVDFNNDLRPDLMSLDMLPEDLRTLKSAAAEYNYPIYQRYIKNDYNHQFMQNTFHLNLGNETFSELSFLSGIAATEWSWSPLAADFDNDGYKDLYITNGIKGITNDMDFINFISNTTIPKDIDNKTNAYKTVIKELPQRKVPNYMFRNRDGLTFEDMTDKWISNEATFSNGAIYSDLNNDGDLDIIVNEVDQQANIYENHTALKKTNNYLQLEFKGHKNNINGIGAKAIIYTKEKTIMAENYTSTGYLSAKTPKLHFGLGRENTIDSLQIIWPTKQWQTIVKPKVNQKLSVHFSEALGNYYEDVETTKYTNIEPIESLITYTHKDQETSDFSRDPLLPFSVSNNGPDIEIGDLNGDDLEDLVITGAKKQPLEIWLQNTNNGFTMLSSEVFKKDHNSDDTAIAILDVNNDGENEIIVASGGNEFKSGRAMRPRLYYFNGVEIIKDTIQFQNIEINASKISTVDIDNDGDKDICIVANAIPHKFGETPYQYIFQNNGSGNFTNVTDQMSEDFKSVGNVYDIIWQDLDSNGFKDAIMVGHWMPVTIFFNDGKILRRHKDKSLDKTSGWWNTLVAEDFDNDGDIDLMAGNWGLNTRLRASKEEPITLYRQDFDNNGTAETIVTYFYDGTETTIATKDELSKQLPKLNKKFLSYADFGNATIEELFGKYNLKTSKNKKVNLLETCYFENLGNATFKVHKLPLLVQNSSIHHILVEDLNKDGYKDVILTGNNFELSTQIGRLDANRGVVLINDKNGFFNIENLALFDIFGQVRDVEILNYKGQDYYVVGRNKERILFYPK
ncbi:VCBS repeat-containing protein [uncultured Winogradskyella sp.]|uniref:VCBS repeat-containing protein n=1 Tax=uncultured Winogradskyella sp. TaxID=395353 RepID=UPI00262FBC87|nr:VCBS repeat-containing protein [uncultured Winogradskyella sp.]